MIVLYNSHCRPYVIDNVLHVIDCASTVRKTYVVRMVSKKEDESNYLFQDQEWKYCLVIVRNTLITAKINNPNQQFWREYSLLNVSAAFTCIKNDV